MASREAIRAITFDVGGTLITPWPSVGHVYAEVAGQNGHSGISPVVLNQQFAVAWNALKGFQHTRQEWAKLVDASFRGLLDPLPSRTFFSSLYDRFAEPDAWHVFQDVTPALAKLRNSRFRLGIISNWDDRLRPLLRALKLDLFFETIVVSGEVGFPKPSPHIYQRAAKDLGLDPAHIRHIGDSMEMDFQGASAAEFQALLIHRKRDHRAAKAIASLDELDSMLGL
jgi:putative hydrolase of the HAD superfamily